MCSSCTFVKCAVGVREKSTVGSLSEIFPTLRNSGAKIAFVGSTRFEPVKAMSDCNVRTRVIQISIFS